MLKKIVIGAVAAGTVALGAVGVADAASGSAAPATPVPAVVAANPLAGSGSSTRTSGRTFNCSKGPKVLKRIATVEARISAGLPKLNAAEQRATQKGNTKRAARIERLITRLESSKFQARLQRVSQRVEQTCHISAPTGSTGSTGSTSSSGSTTSA